MIRNYTPPRLTIETRFDILPEAVAERSNPVVVGPLYNIQRYGHDDITGVYFTPGGTTLPYTGASADDLVDAEYTRVFGEDLEVDLEVYPASGTDPRFLIKSSAEAEILRFEENGSPVFCRANDPVDLDSTLQGRNMQVGDIIRVTSTGGTFRRIVTGFIGEDLPAEIAPNAEAASSNPEASTFAISDESTPAQWDVDATGTYYARVEGPVNPQNEYGDRYILTVTKGGDNETAEVSIRSYSGAFSADGVVSADGGTSQEFEFSDSALAGLTVTITGTASQTELVNGQVFAFTVTGDHTPLTVSDPIVTNNDLQVDTSLGYTGSQSTRYVIRVVEGVPAGGNEVDGARIRITDTAGIDTPQEFDILDDQFFAVGTFGVQAKFVASGMSEPLRANDVFTIDAVAERQSTERFDKVILNGPAADPSSVSIGTSGKGVVVRHRMPFTGEIKAKDAPDGVLNFESKAIEDGVEVRSGLKIFVPERNATPGTSDWPEVVRDLDNGALEPYEVDNEGKLFLTYRALQPRASMLGPVRIDRASQLMEYGPVIPDNTLLYGARAALLGGDEDTVVYMMQIRSNDAEGYNEALERLTVEDIYYAIVPLTDDNNIKLKTFLHARDESGKVRMNFRAAYVGTDSPGEYPLIDRRPSGGVYNATIMPTTGGNRLVRTNDVNFLNYDIVPGDKFRYSFGQDVWGDDTYDEYEIVDILNEKELLLKSGPVAPNSVPTRFEIWKPDTARGAAEYVKRVSRSLRDGFGANIWSDTPYRLVDGRLQQIPNYFGAAYYAGLRTSVAPHQPLTRATIPYYQSSPGMYSRFNDEILNGVAAEGTLIIHHRAPQTEPFVRHQLWTDTTSILTREDSIRTNVHFILYEIKDALDPFVGRRNANTTALIAIRNVIDNILTENTEADLIDATNLGPRLIAYEILQLRILPSQADTIDLKLRLTVPAPINNIDVVVGIGVTDEEITVDLNPQNEDS